MKAKSMKLRFLITQMVLFRYTDENHRLTVPKLNKFLRPYGLDCTSRTLSDTANMLREFGYDISFRGQWNKQGYWWGDRPLEQKQLDKLIFAVSCNPYISKQEADEILSSLSPFVTVYQEPTLFCPIQHSPILKHNNHLYQSYAVVNEAIAQQRPVRYILTNFVCDKETGEIKAVDECPKVFTPKCLYQAESGIYMFGYSHFHNKIMAVDLRNITEIKLAFKHNYIHAEKVAEMLKDVDPECYIPQEVEPIIYEGPAIFFCRGQYLQDVIRLVGFPDVPVKKDTRCRCKLTYNSVQITPKMLFALSRVPGYGVRMEGSERLTEAVRGYYRELSDTLIAPFVSVLK